MDEIFLNQVKDEDLVKYNLLIKYLFDVAAKALNYNETLISFDDEKINDILKIMVPGRYDMKLNQLKKESEEK